MLKASFLGLSKKLFDARNTKHQIQRAQPHKMTTFAHRIMLATFTSTLRVWPTLLPSDRLVQWVPPQQEEAWAVACVRAQTEAVSTHPRGRWNHRRPSSAHLPGPSALGRREQVEAVSRGHFLSRRLLLRRLQAEVRWPGQSSVPRAWLPQRLAGPVQVVFPGRGPWRR